MNPQLGLSSGSIVYDVKYVNLYIHISDLSNDDMDDRGMEICDANACSFHELVTLANNHWHMHQSPRRMLLGVGP